MSNRRPGDFGFRSDRARVPTKGLRQRLRLELKSLGYICKYRTDELRNGTLVVMGTNLPELPITEFDGRQIQLHSSRIDE